jgi:hypothetical protein
MLASMFPFTGRVCAAQIFISWVFGKMGNRGLWFVTRETSSVAFADFAKID